jgi:hypothetical protein
MLFSPVFAKLQPRTIPPACPGPAGEPRSAAVQPPQPNLCRNPSRINTCKSITKQTTLTIFRMNTYEKQGVGGILLAIYLTTSEDQAAGRCWGSSSFLAKAATMGLVRPFTSFRVNLHGRPEWRIGGVPYLQKVAMRRGPWLTRARAKPGPGKRPL